MRVEGNDEAADQFRNFLLSVGDGTANERLVLYDALAFKMRLPDDLILDGTCQMRNLAAHVYPDLRAKSATTEYTDSVCKRAIVYGINEEVNAYKNLLAAQSPRESVQYLSIDQPLFRPGNANAACSVDFLNSLDVSRHAPHKLDLKPGMPVLLTRNLDMYEGHVNGSKYIIDRCSEHSIVGIKVSGSERKVFVFFRIKDTIDEEDNPVSFERFQFPLRPSFAITANKAQGQTLDCVGISLLRSFFTHGQLYVALSRVKSRENVKCLLPVSSDSDRFVDNVVYCEVLNSYQPLQIIPVEQIITQ